MCLDREMGAVKVQSVSHFVALETFHHVTWSERSCALKGLKGSDWSIFTTWAKNE